MKKIIYICIYSLIPSYIYNADLPGTPIPHHANKSISKKRRLPQRQILHTYAEAKYQEDILDVFASLPGDGEFDQYGTMISQESCEEAASSSGQTELAQKIEQQLHISQPKEFIQLIANDHHTYRLPSKHANPNLLNVFIKIKQDPTKDTVSFSDLNHLQVETIKQLIEQAYRLKKLKKNKRALLKALSRTPLPAIEIPEYIHQIDFKKLPASLSMQLQHLLHTTPKEALAKTPVPAQLKYAYLNQQYKELLTKLIPYTQSENNLLFKAVALQWIRSIKMNKPIKKSVHQELETLAATFPANFKESLLNLIDL